MRKIKSASHYDIKTSMLKERLDNLSDAYDTLLSENRKLRDDYNTIKYSCTQRKIEEQDIYIKRLENSIKVLKIRFCTLLAFMILFILALVFFFK